MEKFTVLKNETFNVGTIQKQRVVIKQTNNKPMKQNEVKKLVKMLEQKYRDKKAKDPKILVRGIGIDGVFCLKQYDETVDNMFDDIEDYLRGRVKNTTKYTEFTQIEISMFS
jgi:hypothetical protein